MTDKVIRALSAHDDVIGVDLLIALLPVDARRHRDLPLRPGQPQEEVLSIQIIGIKPISI